MPIDELPQSQRTLVRGLNALLRDQQGEGPRPDGDSAPLGDDFPKDFEDLAKRGAVRTGDAPTELALVFADGNRIGKMIQEWLDRGGTAADDASVPVPKSAIVVALDHATKSAIVAATRLTFRPWLDVPEAPPVLVHLAGGDDVLVSVPAAYGWTFARNLSAAFTEACGRPQPASVNPQATPGPDGLVTNPLQLAFGEGQLPSISIGLVFHHNSHPIADVIDKAESQLHHAKRAFSGREAAIAFHDLTSDGEAAPAQEWSRPDPPGRPAVKAMTLSAAASTIDALTRTSRAHRATLLQLLRECRDGDPAQGDLGRRVEQISDPAIIEAVRSCPGTSKDAIVRGLLEHKDPQHRNHLRLLLDIARHWQAEGDRDDCP